MVLLIFLKKPMRASSMSSLTSIRLFYIKSYLCQYLPEVFLIFVYFVCMKSISYGIFSTIPTEIFLFPPRKQCLPRISLFHFPVTQTAALPLPCQCSSCQSHGNSRNLPFLRRKYQWAFFPVQARTILRQSHQCGFLRIP